MLQQLNGLAQCAGVLSCWDGRTNAANRQPENNAFADMSGGEGIDNQQHDGWLIQCLFSFFIKCVTVTCN